MSLSVVQSIPGLNATSTSPATTPTFSSTTGNLLVVGIRVGGSNSIASVKNAAGVAFTALTAVTSGTVTTQLWYLKNITGNASDAITTTFGGAGNNAVSWIWEISGADTASPLDAQATGSNAFVSPITSGSFSTAFANEIIIAFSTINQSGTTTYAAGSGYTLDSQAGFPNSGGFSIGFAAGQHQIVSSIQSTVTSSMTFTNVGGSGGTLALIAVGTFKAAPSTGTPNTLMMMGCGT